MSVHRGNRVLWFSTLIFPLVLHPGIGIGQTAPTEEMEQQPPTTVEQIVSETVEAEPSESMEEIIVYGDKPLRALRRGVYRAEENFFDVFSSLNQDDEYDVRCYYENPSFTHIRRHVCRANFVVDATSAESARFLGKVGGPALPAELVIRTKRERLRELVEALVAERPELLQALSEYTDARQILESEKKRRTEE